MPADLLADTAVTPLADEPGAYTCEIGGAWNYQTPLGGVLMSIAIRAMQAELQAPALRLLSANCVFCSPVPEGPLEIRVEVIRCGRTAAQVRARLASTVHNGPGLEVTATFAAPRRGPDMCDVSPPDVPPPQACPDLFAPPPDGQASLRRTPAFISNYDARLAIGHHWWARDWSGGAAKMARWIRYLRPPTVADGSLDPLAIPPVVDVMPAALWEGVGPRMTRWIAPSLDLTVHFVAPAQSEWLLISGHCRRAWDGYATATMDVFDADGGLVAFSTQTMLIKTLPQRD